LFGAPAAYEDHPQRGLYAALQIQRELREHGEHRAAAGHARLEARIGVNTGEVVVRNVETGGRVEYTPIGHTPNLASRLQTIAPAGSIAVSEHTQRLVEGYFELRALGPRAIRGIRKAIEVYEVTGLGTLRTHFELSTRRGLTKFVGRESELEQMRRALELAMSGQGQMVAVVAEAGTGKSRLYYEFKATLPASRTRMMPPRGARKSVRCWRRLSPGSKTPCHICSDCWASSKVPIRLLRWTRRSESSARST
jgi:hypothetical protein